MSCIIPHGPPGSELGFPRLGSQRLEHGPFTDA